MKGNRKLILSPIKSKGVNRANMQPMQPYMNPTVAYDGAKHYQATKEEVSQMAQAIKMNNPSLAAKLMANNELRSYAAEIVTTYGPGFAMWGGGKIAGYLANRLEGNGGNGTTILSPARRTPGGGANVSIQKVFSGKANPVSNTSYALSSAPNPKPISLNSGIEPNTFVNDYMTPIEGMCSPLHMTNVILGIPQAAGNTLSSYFTNTICFDIQTRAQEAVGFSLDITNTLSAANLVTAFTAVINALQCYFYYSSILSYESDSRNKNSGMIALRAKVDAVTLSDYRQLGRRLEDTPCPPRLLQWIRYMSGNFLSSNTQGAPLIKTCPNPNYYYGTAPATSYPLQALNALNTTTNTAVFALLRRCVPNWRIGKLFDVPSSPLYDKNFLTIFANLPSANRASGSLVVGNSVTNTTTAVPYNCFNNNLDGLAFAMGGAWDSVNTCWYPGLVNLAAVNVTYTDNRYSFYTVSGITQFYPVSGYALLGLSRQETVTNVLAISYTPHLFGSDKCQNVTGAALLQSGQTSLDYLFDTSSIQTKKIPMQYS